MKIYFCNGEVDLTASYANNEFAIARLNRVVGYVHCIIQLGRELDDPWGELVRSLHDSCGVLEVYWKFGLEKCYEGIFENAWREVGAGNGVRHLIAGNYGGPERM